MSQEKEKNVELSSSELEEVAGGAINITAPVSNTVGTTSTTTVTDTQTNPLSTDDKSKTTFHY